MSKREKRLQRLRQNPKNVSFDSIHQVLADYGFSLQRIEGSHHIFIFEGEGRTWKIVIPYNKPVKIAYIKSAIKAIDEVRSEAEEADADRDDSDDSDSDN